MLQLRNTVVATLACASLALAADFNDPKYPINPDTGLHQRPPAGYVPKTWPAGVALGMYLITAAIIWWQWARMGRQKFLLCLPIGLTTMFIGYGMRIGYIRDVFSVAQYATSTLFILLSPCAFLAFDYVLLSRLSASLGEEIARKCLFMPARLIVRIFVWGDVVVFLMQAAGGGLSAIDNRDTAKIGEKIMIVGLALQVVFFGLFTMLLVVFGIRVRKNFPEHWFVQNSEGWSALNFGKSPVHDWRILFWVMLATCVGIVVRCVFRAAEYGGGYDSYLATTEAYFYLLDALPLWLAVNLYCIFWPGRLLHKDGPSPKSLGRGHTATESTLEMGSHEPKSDITMAQQAGSYKQ